jgi:hypothetical protein
LTLRARPTPLLGIAIALGYIVVFIGLERLLGGDMGDMTSAAKLRPFILALAASAALLSLLTTALGWWGPVWRDRVRLEGPLRFTPALWIAVIALMLVAGRGWTLPGDRLAAALLLGVLVGFSEELAFRGLALTGLRGVIPEQRAWFLSTLLFALLHTPNMMLGIPPSAALLQTCLAFAGGTGLYLIRRSSGGIAVAMILHGAWDLSMFVNQRPSLALVPLTASLLIFLVFLAQRRHVFGSAVPGTAA